MASRRYDRESPQFSRVANLSDGVFAIALTLLVLTLDRPEVPAAELPQALIGQLPQLGVFALGFLLIANVWWFHHRLFGLLKSVESGMIVINLALLGAVALLPYPTNVLGHSPTATAAVVQFTAAFIFLTLLYLGLLLRAQAVQAWLQPVPPETFAWITGSWLLSTGILIVSLVLAFWSPIIALIILAMSGLLVGVTMALTAPPAYGEWGL